MHPGPLTSAHSRPPPLSIRVHPPFSLRQADDHDDLEHHRPRAHFASHDDPLGGPGAVCRREAQSTKRGARSAKHVRVFSSLSAAATLSTLPPALFPNDLSGAEVVVPDIFVPPALRPPAPAWALRAVPQMAYRFLQMLTDGEHVRDRYAWQDSSLAFSPMQRRLSQCGGPFISFEFGYAMERMWCAQSRGSIRRPHPLTHIAAALHFSTPVRVVLCAAETPQPRSVRAALRRTSPLM